MEQECSWYAQMIWSVWQLMRSTRPLLDATYTVGRRGSLGVAPDGSKTSMVRKMRGNWVMAVKTQ